MSNFTRKIVPFFPLFLQVMRFGVVGVSAAFVNFSIVVMLVQWTAMEPLMANIFGFMISFQVSYFGHRKWTFSDVVVLHRLALPKLLIVQIGNLFASEFLFYFFLSLKLAYPLALLCVLMILPIFTFITSKLWVFR